MKFYVKYKTKTHIFNDFNEAMTFCFDLGIDPDECIYTK